MTKAIVEFYGRMTAEPLAACSTDEVQKEGWVAKRASRGSDAADAAPGSWVVHELSDMRLIVQAMAHALGFGRSRASGGIVRVVSDSPLLLAPILSYAASERNEVSVFWVRGSLIPLIEGNSLNARVARWCVRRALARSVATVYASQTIRDTVERLCGRGRFSAVIPLGSIGTDIPNVAPSRRERHDRVHIVDMRGNLRRSRQSAPVLAEDFGDRIDVHVLAHAAERDRALAGAELALFSFETTAEACTGLEQLYPCLRAGTAVVVQCDPAAEFAELIRKHDCGWVIPVLGPEALRDGLQKITAEPSEIYSRRCRAFAVWHLYYALPALGARWTRLFSALVEPLQGNTPSLFGAPVEKTKGRELIIVGAGGFGSKVLNTVRAINAQSVSPKWEVVGFVDDAEKRVGTMWDGYPVIATPETLPEVWIKTASFACAIGDNRIRREVVERLEKAGFVAETIVHPTAVVADNAELGRGVYVDALCVIAANSRIGAHALINMQVGIGHHVKLGEFSQICPGGKIGGYAVVGDGAFVGTSASVLPGKKIGTNAIVGAVSMVAHDVEAGDSVMGIPARRFLVRGVRATKKQVERRALIIIGAGGAGLEALAVARRMLERDEDLPWYIAGFVADDKGHVGELIEGTPRLGRVREFLAEMTPEKHVFHCAIGDNKARRNLSRLFEEHGIEPLSLIDPQSVIASSAVIGAGCYVAPAVFVGPQATVGKHVLINAGAGIGHHCVIENYAQLCPGSRVSGNAVLGEASFIGSNAVVAPRVTIGDSAIVGGASLAATNIAAHSTAVGIPARVIFRSNPGSSPPT